MSQGERDHVATGIRGCSSRIHSHQRDNALPHGLRCAYSRDRQCRRPESAATTRRRGRRLSASPPPARSRAGRSLIAMSSTGPNPHRKPETALGPYPAPKSSKHSLSRSEYDLRSVLGGQLRDAEDEGIGEWSAGASAAAAGVGGSAGRHFATKTVRSSIPNPIAIARSHAFISLAIRSRRIRRCFIRDPVLTPLSISI
jgi:hypothetical protein